ncbi:MAG: hypothetical protein A6D92_01540 [Symbiobacterium thermophilum]|uniref:Uncharacterized protein n=1 Tax=Symbiobacterium thermophilum TaxID=2734 RepID=A0A1Y2TAC4_SYMTR|nr:MAG: hypothetical protein A6D92_01540 [Symbiobacterium thermophilum]
MQQHDDGALQQDRHVVGHAYAASEISGLASLVRPMVRIGPAITMITSESDSGRNRRRMVP